jgi:serine phosphatase RsbU (regulator of sigma subunit)
MTMLPTYYSMCDQDNDLMTRSDQSEFVESTNANPLLDFCLDDLTHKELVVGRAERDGGVEFVSAGHPPVLHLRKDTARHESATGIPLGVFDGVRFPSRRMALDPGDMLLLYTDGLTESCNSAGEEYGFHRIKRVARQHLQATPSKLISECLSDTATSNREENRWTT